jgi:hypothetical protein
MRRATRCFAGAETYVISAYWLCTPESAHALGLTQTFQ